MIVSSPKQNEFTRVGHYRIIKKIGQGGMGLVYLARDERLERDIAVKCLRGELCEPNYRKRFKHEALLLAKLNHANIVQIYDYIETDDLLALAMEFVDGNNLKLYLRERPVSLFARMKWLTQIAQGLATAHELGIVHRDLKPENILINQRGYAKISDFGIAKIQSHSAASADFNSTLTDHVVGSYAYMSPEQALGEAVDFKTDLFSFGIVAYELLCGAHPFGEADNKLQIMQRIISHAPISPLRFNPQLPTAICQLLMQLLCKNSDSRPNNTGWVAAQFEQLSASVLGLDEDSNPTQKINSPMSSVEKLAQPEAPTTPLIDFPKVAPRLNAFFTKAGIVRKKTLIALSLLISCCIGAGILWNVNAPLPVYVAVLPATLEAEAMPEAQQELVKITVIDTLQQSVLQLKGYFLIPREQVEAVTGDAETILKATAADEVITTRVRCKRESCTITITRLTPDKKHPQGRLRVMNTKTIDVLTDNFLSVADTVQNNLGQLYSTSVSPDFKGVDEKQYSIFLNIYIDYLHKGANDDQLTVLDNLRAKTKALPAVAMLYKDICLDLHFEKKNKRYLEKLEEFIQVAGPSNSTLMALYNIFYLQVAKAEFDAAVETIEKIKDANPNQSIFFELHAYLSIAKNDYKSAIKFYQKALDIRVTFSNLFNIANAYWYAGDATNAKASIRQALAISAQYKAFSQLGIIYLTEGHIDMASQTFEEAIKRKPDDVSILDNLGLCYLLKNQYEKARELFDRASRIAPSNWTIVLNKADAINLAGNLQESRHIYSTIIAALNSDSSLVANSNSNLAVLAQAYAHLGQYSDALTTLQQLETLDPQNVFTQYTAALVHVLANNNASAVLSVKESLRNGINVIWFHFPWFDQLCDNAEFAQLMVNSGAPQRCALHLAE